jgi:hypothetical protein
MAMASTSLLEVVADVLRTADFANITINVTIVQFHMASAFPEVVAYVLQTVYLALKINANNVHLSMASTVPEVVAHAFQTV